MANITGYTPQGQAYYTDPNTKITNYLNVYRDPPTAAPAPAPAPVSGGLLNTPAPAAAPVNTAKPPAIPVNNAAAVNGLVPVTTSQWNAMTPTGAPGNTFAGNLFATVQANNGLARPIYDAIHNDPGTYSVAGGYGTDQASIKAYADKIDPYYQVTAAPAANRTGTNVAQGGIYDQLQQQAKDNGYSWVQQNGNYDGYTAAGLLSNQGVNSLSDLGFAADGKTLINKTTGQPLTTREQDQLGMSAAGNGRVDYDITKDANGNPIIKPTWKSSQTDLGALGTLAPIALSLAFPGFGSLGAAALSGGLTIAQGGELWDALKSAGLTYAGAEVGDWAKTQIGDYLKSNGITLPDISGKSGSPTGTDYSLGDAKFGDAFTTGDNGLGKGLLGGSTGSAGGNGMGLSLPSGIWDNVSHSYTTTPYTATDYSLQNGTTPINNNGSGLSTGPSATNGGTGGGLSVSPGTGLNLNQPNGSGGLLGNGSDPFVIGGTSSGIGSAASLIAKAPQIWPYVAAAVGAGAGAAGSTSSGSGYKDDGYRPTITQSGWSPTASPTLGGPSGIGLISIPKKGKGEKDDGLWRYGLLGG